MTDGEDFPMMPNVLLTARSAFETAYVASALADHAIVVVGSNDDLAHALGEVQAGEINAAVLDFRIGAPSWSVLIDELVARDTPILLLVQGEVVPSVTRGCSVLARPFAAHQVANWVVQSIRQPRSAAQQQLQGKATDVPHETHRPRVT